PYLTQQDLKDLHDAGANYVNFSIPGPFDPKTGECNKDDWNHLCQLVRWAKDAKLKIVIAFRTGPGRNEDDFLNPPPATLIRDLMDVDGSPNIAKFAAMWKMVATTFKDEPAVVGYDLLVEPHGPKQGDYFQDYNFRKQCRWKKVAVPAIQAIRS